MDYISIVNHYIWCNFSLKWLDLSANQNNTSIILSLICSYNSSKIGGSNWLQDDSNLGNFNVYYYAYCPYQYYRTYYDWYGVWPENGGILGIYVGSTLEIFWHLDNNYILYAAVAYLVKLPACIIVYELASWTNPGSSSEIFLKIMYSPEIS